MNTQVSVKEFFRRLRTKLPYTVSSSEHPILLMEFEGRDRGTYQSRIAVYGVDTEDMVKYKYTADLDAGMDEWPQRHNTYVIQKIVRPTRSLVLSRRRPLAIIQVRDGEHDD